MVWETVDIGVQKTDMQSIRNVLGLIKVYLHESCIFLSLIFSVLFRLLLCYLSVFPVSSRLDRKKSKNDTFDYQVLVVSFEGSLHVMLQLA